MRDCKPALLHRGRDDAQALALLLHPARCEQRLALAFERLRQSIGGDLLAERRRKKERGTDGGARTIVPLVSRLFTTCTPACDAISLSLRAEPGENGEGHVY